jgi:hypothetical protein
VLVRIIVNRHNVLRNKKHGTRLPIFSIHKSGQKVERSNSINLPEGAKLIYSPGKPLNCGATVWIEYDDNCKSTAESDSNISELFHKLWGNAIVTNHYIKSNWTSLQKLLQKRGIKV